ncbi:MAG: hypothetical protein ACE5JO_07680 [Candidatus Binatia bacterium]
MNAASASLSFEDLLIHAEGNVSTLFGNEFSVLDHRLIRIRMPSPPLLLIDRVIELNAKRGVYEGSFLLSETDLTDGKWYLQDGYIPTGVYSEGCQGILLLLSKLGIEFLNKRSERFRLLGSKVAYYGGLPKVGDKLKYKISLNSLVNQEGSVIAFFLCECYVDGRLRLRGYSNAGFFALEELIGARGILWNPVENKDRVVLDGPLLTPVVSCKRQAFGKEQLVALSKGDLSYCFGSAFEVSDHHATPRLSGDRLLFLDRVANIDLEGGPWGRGYLRAETDVDPNEWFFKVHFKNDPVMPGTLMLEGCLQAMMFFLLYMGFSLERDGHHFEPVSGHTQQFRCRGQVYPESRHVVYEVFVQEIGENPHPYIRASVQVFSDGLKIFLLENACVQMAPNDLSV